jgi:imidazolonepropionase-like amidohydrolase
VVGDAAAAEQLVAEHHERGVDVIKVMASGGLVTAGTDVYGVQFTSEVLGAVVASAHRLGLGVLAHAHSLSGIRHALNAGVDGIEHFTGLTPEGIDIPDDVLDLVVAGDVAVDPTLGYDKEALATMPAPPGPIAELLRTAGLDFETAYANRLRLMARAHDRGVRIVSGTDAGVGPLKGHGGLAAAVVDLLDARMSAEQALATATSSSAVACGVDGSTGRLSQGLAADLLVVDGDLRSDLGALQRPTAVVVRGLVVPQARR